MVGCPRWLICQEPPVRDWRHVATKRSMQAVLEHAQNSNCPLIKDEWNSDVSKKVCNEQKTYDAPWAGIDQVNK